MPARKTNSNPTRIWKFGALSPTTNIDGVRDQLFLASRYKNSLVELARNRYEAFRRIRREHSPEYAQLDDEYQAVDSAIQTIYETVKANRAKVYRRTGGPERGGVKTLDFLPPEHREQVEVLQATKKSILERLAVTRKAFTETMAASSKAFTARVQALSPNNQTMAACKAKVLEEMVSEGSWSTPFLQVTQSELETTEKRKALRSTCGLSSGTYLQVEAAADKAAKDSLQPSFKGFRGDGKLAVQLTKNNSGPRKGLDTTWGEILAGSSSKIRLIDQKYRNTKGAYYIVQLNIGRDRQDVWADFPVLLHRMPPKDAAVKWAWVTSRREAGRIRYQFQITLEHSSFAEAKRPSGVGTTHVKIGWAQTPEGITVASYGENQTVTLPQGILSQGVHADKIKSYADIHYDNIKTLLRRIVRPSNEEERETFQELLSPRTRAERRRIQLRQRCRAFTQETLGERVHLLWAAWKSTRLLHHQDLYAEPHVISMWLRSHGVTTSKERLAFILQAWRLKDEHLHQYHVDEQRRFEARRLAFFRTEAIRIATQFEKVTVDGYNIAGLKRLPELNTRANRPIEAVQSNLHEAAPGRFREVLLDVLGPRGSKVSRVEVYEILDASETEGPSRTSKKTQGRQPRKRGGRPSSSVEAAE